LHKLGVVVCRDAAGAKKGSAESKQLGQNRFLSRRGSFESTEGASFPFIPLAQKEDQYRAEN